MRNGGWVQRFAAVVCVAVALVGAAAIAGCSDDDGEAEASRASVPQATTTTAEPTTTTTVASTTTTTEPAPQFEPLLADPALTPEEQVEAAYLFSWEIYLDALRRTDSTSLPVVYSAAALDLRVAEIDALAVEGRYVDGEVSHSLEVVMVDESSAFIVDGLENHLILHDRVTQEPLEPDPNSTLAYQTNLEKVADRWVVVEVLRL